MLKRRSMNVPIFNAFEKNYLEKSIFQNATRYRMKNACIKWYVATLATTLVASDFLLELSIDTRLIENDISITKDG